MKVKSKPLPPPRRRMKEREKEAGVSENEEEIEMKGLETTAEDCKDDNYCFEDPANIGITPSAYYDPLHDVHIYNINIIGAVTSRNGIPEADFPDHVKQMHMEGNLKFELEYKVRTMPYY